MFKTVLAALAASVALWAAPVVHAADYPNRPVKLVVPLAAGSATDILARQMARWLEAEWKQPVIVENRPGAGSILAADYVAKQPADGYTLLLTGSSLVIAPLIDRNATFRIGRDLIPVARVAVLRIVLATNTSVPARNLQEFAALTRANPGKMNYAGLGRTSVIDTGIEVLKKGLDMDLTPVAYKGAAEHNTALIRNDVQLVWGGATVLKHQAATGKVRILAAVSDHRFPNLPDVPTVVEAGHTGFIPRVWTGIVAPGGTPVAIQEQINRDVNRILARPEAAALLSDQLGNDPAPLPPGAFTEQVNKESAFWAAMFKELKIEPQ
jgi:tripartite-type tricarboxylate transporter receptor subunit TctC